jgi:hypothetical protein
VELVDVKNALLSARPCTDTTGTDPRISTEGEAILLCNDWVCVRLIPVISRNEIELSIELVGKLSRYGGDAIQAWLGEPVHAYMFSADDLESVATKVIQTACRILECFKANPAQALQSIEAASNELSKVSLEKWIRQEADEAWRSRQFEKAVELYSRVPSALSDSEKKRVQIAKRLSKER